MKEVNNRILSLCLYLFPTFNERMQQILNLTASRRYKLQLLQVQTFELFEKIDLLIKIIDVCAFALDLTLHHWNSALTFL